MKVNTDELVRQASELRQVAGRLNDIQDSVLRVARSLSRESVGERFLPSLMDASRALGNRSEDLRKMRRALEQIADMYEGSEMRIVDEAEHAAIPRLIHAIRPIVLPEMRIMGGPDAYNPHRDREIANPEYLEQLFRQWDAEAHAEGNISEAILEQRYFVTDNRGPGIPDLRERIDDMIRSGANTGTWSDSPGTGGIPRSVRQIIESVSEVVRERFPENPSEVIGTNGIPRAGQRIAEMIGEAAEPMIDWTPWNP